ncbi:btk-binding protein-related [Anaeramoeba flamelloides]|uniref:Btk-binding protein-related n=1 Tax=Anaeramoeba flamelloides TaxID=1746091 RepID=A0ABQ8YFE9_9EUKA|nr:btk-binding protein-related [Anaeramoeba flamelloides]
MQKPEIYFSGNQKFLQSLLLNKGEYKRSNWNKITNMKEIEKVKKFAHGDEFVTKPHLLIWKGVNKLELIELREEGQRTTLTIENEEIKDIQGGQQNFFVLTKSGKVYSLADGKKDSVDETIEIPFEDYTKSNLKTPRCVTFFEKNNLLVDAIAIGNYTNYFLCKNDILYASGWNTDGELGNGGKEHRRMPNMLCKNVQRVFAGKDSNNMYYISTNDELFACGQNNKQRLGVGNTAVSITRPTKVILQNIPIKDASEILDIQQSINYTLILTNKGKIYYCGTIENNQQRHSTTTFMELAIYKNIKIAKICSTSSNMFLLSEEGKLFGIGITPSNILRTNYDLSNTLGFPKYFHDLKGSNFLSSFNMNCGYRSIFLFLSDNSILKKDLKKFFESKKYCDSKINCLVSNNQNNQNNEKSETSIPVHKILIELRSGLKLDEIQKIINENNFSQEAINEFLKWIYYDSLSSSKTLKQIFDACNLVYPPKQNFKNDFLKLFNDDDSKDFNLLVKEDDYEDEDDDDDDDENDDDEYEEMPVHKIILLARSGLFRELFENLNENEKNLNQIKDYSGKSIESLEIFLKYLYTDKIEFTADDDPELIIEELTDAVEYYQLNEESNLTFELNKHEKK